MKSYWRPRAAGNIASFLRSAWAGLSLLTLGAALWPYPGGAKGMLLNLLALNLPGSAVLTLMLGYTSPGDFGEPGHRPGSMQTVLVWFMYTAVGYVQWFLFLPRRSPGARN